MNYSYVGTVVLRKPKMLGSRNERQIVGAKHHRLGLAVETGKFIDMIALLLIFLARKGAKRLSLIDIFAVIAVVYKRKLVAEVLLEKLFLIGTKTAKAKLFAFLLCVLGLYAALIWLFQLESVVQEMAEATPGLILALLGTGCVTFLLTDVLLRRFAVLWRRKLRGRWMRG